MYEYLKQEDKDLISKISNYDCDDLIKEVNNLDRTVRNLVFSTEYMTLDQTLNKKGLHLLRILLADRMNYERQEYRKHKYNDLLLDEWRDRGCLIFNDLFSDKDIVNGYLRPNDAFRNIMQMTLGEDNVPTYSHMNIQDLPSDRGDDPQCHSHFDTFHPAVKVWIYLSEITLDHAPFCIAPGTHINNEKRLRFMYDISCNITYDLLYNTKDRFHDKNHIFDEPQPVLGSEYTTIIANVSAFHKRGNGKAGLSRKSARGNLDRKNPFRDIKIN